MCIFIKKIHCLQKLFRVNWKVLMFKTGLMNSGKKSNCNLIFWLKRHLIYFKHWYILWNSETLAMGPMAITRLRPMLMYVYVCIWRLPLLLLCKNLIIHTYPILLLQIDLVTPPPPPFKVLSAILAVVEAVTNWMWMNKLHQWTEFLSSVQPN